jgi:D-sedoheptulose 7-phosphate isomerase
MKLDFKDDIDNYFFRLKSTLDKLSREELAAFMALLLEALEKGTTVFIMGNGGSAATASHFASDFNKGLSWRKASRFRFHCLNDNVPTITAYANDVGYEDIFVEQLRNLLRPGDIVVAISGSGNSANVIKAVKWANANGGRTVSMTGYDGGELRRLASSGVHVPIDDMQVTEDIHMIFDHLCYAVLGRRLPAEAPLDSGSAGEVHRA